MKKSHICFLGLGWLLGAALTLFSMRGSHSFMMQTVKELIMMNNASMSSGVGDDGVVHAGTTASTMRRTSASLHATFSTDKVGPDEAYKLILAAFPSSTHTKLVLEVGMHSITTCKVASDLGFDTHCFEPSPVSFSRIMNTVERTYSKESGGTPSNLHIYNQAAGDVSHTFVNFSSGGGTGDHVGDVSPWSMEKEQAVTAALVPVETIRLDDVIQKSNTSALVIKVDTQGFEPQVLSGLTETLKQHAVDFLIMEYWPKGMDALSNLPFRSCICTQIIERLALEYGYELFLFPIMGHPKSPLAKSKERFNFQVPKVPPKAPPQPLTNFTANCNWYYDLEDYYPETDETCLKTPGCEYKMGYWADIIAVAPHVKFPENTTVPFGIKLNDVLDSVRMAG